MPDLKIFILKFESIYLSLYKTSYGAIQGIAIWLKYLPGASRLLFLLSNLLDFNLLSNHLYLGLSILFILLVY